ncbi:hypothetical protein RI367_000110 [Sorochytrium milnesiophthora]
MNGASTPRAQKKRSPSPTKRSSQPEEGAKSPTSSAKRQAGFAEREPQQPIPVAVASQKQQPERSPSPSSSPTRRSARSPTAKAADEVSGEGVSKMQLSSPAAPGKRAAFGSFVKPVGFGSFGAVATSTSTASATTATATATTTAATTDTAKPALSFGSFAKAASQNSGGSLFGRFSSAAAGSTGKSFLSAGNSGSGSGNGGSLSKEGDEDEEAANEDDDTPDNSNDADDATAFDSPSVVHLEEVPVETGEEEDETRHVVRARLYVLEKGEYHERGIGSLKVNVRQYEGKEHARLVMRAEAVHRLLLNIALFPGMKVDITSDRYVRFTAVESGKLVTYIAKVSNANLAADLLESIGKFVRAQDKDAQQPPAVISGKCSARPEPALPPDTPKPSKQK